LDPGEPENDFGGRNEKAKSMTQKHGGGRSEEKSDYESWVPRSLEIKAGTEEDED